MGNTPKSNEEKMNTMLNAWRNLAPDKSFGGMTLAQFQAIAKPAQDARTRLAEIENQRTHAIDTRDDADNDFLAKAQLVVNGVLADPTEGANGALYEAMGYTRKSERKSGLTRKRELPAERRSPRCLTNLTLARVLV